MGADMSRVMRLRSVQAAVIVFTVLLICTPLMADTDDDIGTAGSNNIFWAIIAIFVAQHKNRSGFNWFFICLIFGIIGFIILLFQDELKEES